MPKRNLKESFDVESINGAFYSGGKVKWSEDGTTLFCPSSGTINVIDVDLGKIRLSLGSQDEEEDLVYCFATTKNGSHVISSHKSGLLRYWQILDGALIKHWKNIHKGPIAEMDIDDDGSILATGGSDSTIRIWDIVHNACTHALKGSLGVISVVKFHQNSGKNHIFGCGDDLKINCWDLNTSELLFQLSGHYSKITSLSLCYDDDHLVSCGRDSVVILWNMKTKSEVKTYPAYESLEGAVCLPKKFELPSLGEISGGIHVATAGERGMIRVFDMIEGREIYTQQNSCISQAPDKGGLSIVQLLYNPFKNCFAVITFEHNIILHKLDTFVCIKQLIGFADEILDVVYVGTDNSHLAVATNSSDVKLYQIKDMNCKLLKGHTDIVLTLAVSPENPNLMLSGGKDNSVRLWELIKESGSMICLASGLRHTASVTSVCFSQLSEDFFLSVSEDTTLKMWTIKHFKKKADCEIIVTSTEIAHQKDINCVCISPNDKLIATGSQDKTVKVWSADELTLLGSLTGHRRSIWWVRFSPVDQILLSTSADCTVKLWSVTTLECLKTLEGHDSSVLRAEFITRGMQIITAGSDGLLKLWTIKDSECVGTFSQHKGKIWSLAVSHNEEKLVTGGADSLLITWKDSTEEKRAAALKEREEMIAKDQLLSNLLNSNQLYSALVLALSLDRPLQVLSIIKELYKRDNMDGLKATVKKLSDLDKENLLKCASVWNSNSKNCDAAQVILNILLDEIVCNRFHTTNLSTFVEEVLPYTERHFKRMTNLLEDLHFLKYTVAVMKPANVEK